MTRKTQGFQCLAIEEPRWRQATLGMDVRRHSETGEITLYTWALLWQGRHTYLGPCPHGLFTRNYYKLSQKWSQEQDSNLRWVFAVGLQSRSSRPLEGPWQIKIRLEIWTCVWVEPTT